MKIFKKATALISCGILLATNISYGTFAESVQEEDGWQIIAIEGSNANADVSKLKDNEKTVQRLYHSIQSPLPEKILQCRMAFRPVIRLKTGYIFMQKILCPKCHKIMGGESSTSGTGDKHIYYKCNSCKKRISEKKIESELMKFLNDMLDFFLIVDNSFKPSMCRDIEEEIIKYEKMEHELNDKITKIKQEFMDGKIAAKSFEKELHYLEKEIKNIEIKITELKDLKQNNEHKQDVELFFNMKEIEKLKLKSKYVKEHNLWSKLSQDT